MLRVNTEANPSDIATKVVGADTLSRLRKLVGLVDSHTREAGDLHASEVAKNSEEPRPRGPVARGCVESHSGPRFRTHRGPPTSETRATCLLCV